MPITQFDALRVTVNSVSEPLAAPAGTTGQFVGANGAVSRVMTEAFGTGIYGSFAGRTARGTQAVPTALQNGDEITHLSAWGRGATGYSAASRGFLGMFAAENWTDTAQGLRIGFYTTAPGTTTTSEKVRIWGDGGLQVGGTFTASPGPGSVQIDGNLLFPTAGKGISLKGGGAAAARIGIATLSGGTVTINTSALTAQSRIFVTVQNPQGVTNGNAHVANINVGAGQFDIVSDLPASDTSEVAWMIVEEIP